MPLQLSIQSPKSALHLTFLRQGITRAQADCLKAELRKVFDHIDDRQSEEYHKNLIARFLQEVY